MAGRKDLTSTEYRKARAYVLERDAYTCAYCGQEANTVDHIVPVKLGGVDHNPSNLVAACLSCNSRKGANIHRRLNWVNKRWGVKL